MSDTKRHLLGVIRLGESNRKCKTRVRRYKDEYRELKSKLRSAIFKQQSNKLELRKESEKLKALLYLQNTLNGPDPLPLNLDRLTFCKDQLVSLIKEKQGIVSGLQSACVEGAQLQNLIQKNIFEQKEKIEMLYTHIWGKRIKKS